ncbi:MAG: DUF5715 family protein [Gemmatimonadales bacterium]
MRTLTSLLILIATWGCGRAERERLAAADSAEAATLATIEHVLSETIQRADRLAGSADRILSPRPVMTPGQEEALRRYQNGVHVARARALGVRVVNESALDSLLGAGRLIELEDSTEHWIVRRGASPAYVVPQVRALLAVIGERFQQRLAELDLPAYRLEVTSATRTSERQEDLRDGNANAAAGVSSHEFGVTVDVSYAAFAPPAARPEEIFAGVPTTLRPHVERLVDLALESVSARKSRELAAILSRVLEEAQDEGIAVVIYERQQTVYHLTVAREIVGA